MSVMAMPHGNTIMHNQTADPGGSSLRRIDVHGDELSMLGGGNFDGVVRDREDQPIEDTMVDYEQYNDDDASLLYIFEGHIDADFPNHTFELGHKVSTDVTDMNKSFDPGILRRYVGNSAEENLLLPNPEEYQFRHVPKAVYDYFDESALSHDNAELNMDKWRSGKCNYVYVTGASGSGKSTLAHRIADETGAEIISLDIVGVALRKDKGQAMLEKLKHNKVRLDPAHKSDVHPFDLEFIESHPDMPWATMETDAAHADTAYLTWLADRCAKESSRKFVIEGSNVMYKEPEFFADKPLVIVGTGSMKAHFRRVKRYMSRINAENWLKTIKKGAKLAMNYKFSAEHGKQVDRFRDAVTGRLVTETVSSIPEYYNESAMKASERNALPDEAFGLPRLRAYPLNDKKHVQFAIRMFGHCKDPEDRKILAANIFKAMDRFGVDTKIGKKNPLYGYAPEAIRESSMPDVGVKLPGFDKPLDKRSKDEIVKEHLRINAPFYNQAFYGSDFHNAIKAMEKFEFFEYFYPCFTNMEFGQRLNCVCGGLAVPPGSEVLYQRLGMRRPTDVNFDRRIGWPDDHDAAIATVRSGAYDPKKNWFKVNLSGDVEHSLYCLRLYSIMASMLLDPNFDPDINLTDMHRGILMDWEQHVNYHYDLYEDAENENERLRQIQYLFDLFWNYNDNPRDSGIHQVNVMSMLRNMACVSNLGIGINEANDPDIVTKERLEEYLTNDLDLDKSYYLLPHRKMYPVADRASVRLAMDNIDNIEKSDRREYVKNLNRKYTELGCTFSISADHPYARYADDAIVDRMTRMLLEMNRRQPSSKMPGLVPRGNLVLSEASAVPTIFDMLTKDSFTTGNTREDIAARKYARWRDLFFAGVLGSVAASLFVRVDVVNGDIRIMGINCNLLLVRVIRVFGEARLRHIFEYQYNAASWAAFQRKAIKRGDMRIDYVYAPEFFALELVDLFLVLSDAFGDASYKHIAEQIYHKTWLSKSDSQEIQELDTSRLGNISLTLMPHQVQFIKEWPRLKSRLNLRGYCLAFDPGYGKTLTSIGLAECLNVAHVYIICPNSLKMNWANEIRKYYSKYSDEKLWKRDVHIVGSSFGSAKTAKYFIINNEGLRHLQAIIGSDPDSLVIVDECHNFRNYESSRVRQLIDIVDRLQPENVLCVSATPIKASPAEMTPVLRLIDPIFNDTVAEMYAKCFNLNHTLANELVSKRFGLTIYRPQKINLGLPEKHELVWQLPVKGPQKYHLATVTREVRNEYEARREEWKKQAKVPIAAFMGEVKRYAKAPRTLTNGYLDWVTAYGSIENNSGRFHEVDLQRYRRYLDDYVRPHCDEETYKKLKAEERRLINIVDSIRGRALGKILFPRRLELFTKLYMENRQQFYEAIRKCEKKTVIFTTMIKVAELIGKDLNDYGIKTVVVTGTVVKERQALIDQFKSDPSTMVLVATVQSMGVGHTLIEASQLFFFGLPWRYADYEQAADRIYRIGQTSEVSIINVKLKSKDPNLSDRIEDIMNWSHDMFMTYVDSDLILEGEEMMSESVDTVDDQGTSSGPTDIEKRPYYNRIDYVNGVPNNILDNKEMGPNTKKVTEPDYSATEVFL